MKWLVAVTAGQLCKAVNRSRWTGLGESIDWVSVMSNTHDMLPTVYARWYAKVTGNAAPPHTASIGGASYFATILDDCGPPGLIPDMGVGDDVDGAATPPIRTH